MPPKRTRAQGTGETSNTKSMCQGSENPGLTVAQIAQLIANTVEQMLANRPESHPPPGQQDEEIRKLQEEIARLREERSTNQHRRQIGKYPSPPRKHYDVLSMQMDDSPDELSNYPRSDSPSGYHLSSGESEVLVVWISPYYSKHH
ncbi:hypothetical protein F511_33135 [Dorcoceras hygrometricum]|uniref:Uncharacterized protein n=1 Tax=Dorcoceras hygrometricum TaxID=472368 RepID=A0A2Z7CQ35_9LAMI|nr:hypothetical protein F511_33135 [Dorcoceras hygrometricum]